MIQSIMNIQTTYAKALLVDDALRGALRAGDVLGARRILVAAFDEHGTTSVESAYERT